MPTGTYIVLNIACPAHKNDHASLFICMSQATGASQFAAGGHREAEEAAGEEETSLFGPDASTQPGTEQTQEQE